MDYRIFNVRPYVNACDCTRGVRTYLRESPPVFMLLFFSSFFLIYVIMSLLLCMALQAPWSVNIFYTQGAVEMSIIIIVITIIIDRVV